MLVAGCIRTKKWNSVLDIPKEIIKLIEEFYPIGLEFEGSNLKLTWQEKEYLTKYLSQTLIADENVHNDSLSSVAIYEGDRDGMTAKSWHEKVDGNSNLLTLVQTGYNHIFGCFASIKYVGNRKYHKDLKSFLCLIRTQFKDAECPKLCRYVAKSERPDELCADNGPYDGEKFGPCFGFAFDVGIFSSNSSYPVNYVNHGGSTNYPDAFGNILCGGKELDKTNDINKSIKERKHKPIPFDIKRIETHKITRIQYK